MSDVSKVHHRSRLTPRVSRPRTWSQTRGRASRRSSGSACASESVSSGILGRTTTEGHLVWLSVPDGKTNLVFEETGSESNVDLTRPVYPGISFTNINKLPCCRRIFVTCSCNAHQTVYPRTCRWKGGTIPVPMCLRSDPLLFFLSRYAAAQSVRSPGTHARGHRWRHHKLH